MPHLSQAHANWIHNVGPFPPEVRVWLVLDDEHDVGGDRVRRLVPLPRKRDLGSFLPSPLDLDGEDFVLVAHGPPVRIHPLARDFHPLGAAVENLFQGDPQLVDDRWVLLPPLLAAQADVAVPPGEAVQVEAGERTEGVVPVHLHVLVVPAVGFTAEEHLEGVGPAEEGGEGGVGIAMKGVGEGTALSVAGWSTSSLEAWWQTSDMTHRLF